MKVNITEEHIKDTLIAEQEGSHVFCAIARALWQLEPLEVFVMLHTINFDGEVYKCSRELFEWQLNFVHMREASPITIEFNEENMMVDIV